MSLKKKIEILKNTLQEWENLLESQGEDWSEYDRQVGEIDGLFYAIEILESKDKN